jgi:hypothetical protein
MNIPEKYNIFVDGMDVLNNTTYWTELDLILAIKAAIDCGANHIEIKVKRIKKD